MSFKKTFITCFHRIRVFFNRSFLANKMKGTNISIFLYLSNAIKRPGLANLIKNTPFIRSGYLKSILHRPQLQCLVAPFLFIRFLFPSLVLSIFLRLSTAFKILHIFVCRHFNHSMQLRCIPVSRDNLFVECKRSAIIALSAITTLRLT